MFSDVKRHSEETFGFFGGGGNTTSWRFTDLTRVSSWCIWALTIAADDKLVISKIHLQDFAVGYVTGDRDAVNAGFKEGTDGFKKEIELFGKCFGTEDFEEGTTAFLEKRKPNF